MNYLSGAFRYVAGADADRQDEVHRLVERIKSSSLAQDRRGAIIQLTQIAKESPRQQAEIGEIGLKVFYAVLDQDKQYEGNLRAVIDLLIAICASAESEEPANDSGKGNATRDENAEHEKAVEKARRERTARDIAATNIDMFLGLPDAISLVLEHLSHDDFHIRCTTLELLTAMAANSRQTLQAAILDASQGVNSICDLLDDPQQVVRSNTVLLLSVLCTESPEVSKIVAFSGVPDKLFDLIQVVGPKTGNLSSLEMADDDDDNLEAAIVVQDVLELLASLINCSGTTRTALRELSFVSRIVAVLAKVMRDAGFSSESATPRLNSGSLQLALLKQNARNILLCLSNISGLLQGDPFEAKQMTSDLASTDVFRKLQNLSFLEYVEGTGEDTAINREISGIRMAALRTMSELVKAHSDFRVLFYSSLCPSSRIETATPQICTLHTMLYDRSAALRVAAYASLRDSFVLDISTGLPSPALVNALTGSSSLMSLVQTANTDLEIDDEEEQDISIPAKYLAIFAEALKDALTLYPKSSDEGAVFYSSLLVSWTIIRVPGARERLLASYAHNAGNSLFPQIMRVLGSAQRQQAPPVVRIGLLTLICSWLYNSPSAVSAFLSSAMHLPMVIEMVDNGTNSEDPSSVHIKGLAVIVLGICLEAAEGDAVAGSEGGFISGGRGPSMVIPRGTISDVIRNHIGITAFTARLDDLKATRQFNQIMKSDKLWQLASNIATAEGASEFLAAKGALGHDEWYDSELVTLIGDVYGQVAARAIDLLPTRSDMHDGNSATSAQVGAPSGFSNMQGSDAGPSRTMEMLLADSAKDEVLNSYKELIKGQDENLSAALYKIETLERALREAEGKLSSSEGPSAEYSGDMDPYEHRSNEEANGVHRQAVDFVPRVNESGLISGHPGAPSNSFPSNQGRALAEEIHRGKELQEAVTYLEQQLQIQKEESQTLLDDLDNARRQQEDWRRRAEESSNLVDKERIDKQKALEQVAQLSQTVEMMKSNAQAQADEIAASNRRVSDLEERCAELAEMRKRTEEEVSSLRDEVTLRAEQNIEISGKLYEAEERNATLEEAREKLAAELSAAKAALQSGPASGTEKYVEKRLVDSKLQELETLRNDLGRSRELTEQLNARIGALDETARQYESLQHVNTGLMSELEEVRAGNVELSRKCAVLTESLENLRSGSVARNDFLSLQKEFDERKKTLSSLSDENARLKESVQVARDDFLSLKKELEERNTTLSSLNDENAKLKESVHALEAAAALQATQSVETIAPKRPRHFDAVSSVSESFDSHSEVGRQLGVSLLHPMFKTAGTQTIHDESELPAHSATEEKERVEGLQRAMSEAASIAKQSYSELASAESALRMLHSDRMAVQSRIRDLEGEVRELQDQLSAAKSTHVQREKEFALEKQRAVDEKESIASMAYQQEIDVLCAKMLQVEEKHNELLRTKEGLESSLKEMRLSEAKLLEDNRQVLELLEGQHKKDTNKANEIFNSLHQDLTALLQNERDNAKRLDRALREKSEQLGEVAAKLCCSEAALQVSEASLHAQISRSSRLMEDLEAKQETIKQLQESLNSQITAVSVPREDETRAVRTLENRITSLEAELDTAQQKLRKQREAYDSRIRDFDEDIKLTNQTVEATKRMYEASEASARASSEKSKAVLGALRSELISARAEGEHKAKTIAALEEAKDELEAQHIAELVQLNSKLEESAKSMDVVMMERDSARSTASELTVKVSDLTKSRSDLAEQSKNLSAKLQDAESLVIQLKAKVATALKESAETAEKLSGKSRLLGEKSFEVKKLVGELALEKSALSSLKAQHEKISSEKNSLLDESSVLKKTLAETHEQLRSKEEKLKIALQDSSDLRAWVTELETKAADLQKAASHFEDVEKNLNDSMASHKEAVATIAEVTTELQMAKSELSRAVAASRAAVRSREEAEEEVLSLRKRVSELDFRLRAIRDEHTEKLRTLEESMQRRAKRCADLETSLATVERKLAENANLSDQLYAVESEKSQLSRANQSLRLRADAAEEQLEEMRRTADALRVQLSESQKNAGGNAFKDLEAEHNELLVYLAEMEMECASLKQELGRS